ncbi:hypothetical protein K443DRAFT_615903 [Laccaria amethystina LaAM-08-1]|uniref:DUF7888 domain-containing protein n=1 Tax=Laccaria amethystina LaAM-08-1 TaxID=1095629 RepID=A0A0C9XF00_9AGAR|nr:hypothetical protein K443DRAFT_615903 [Laccaria amethystina LaAM-08-1]
MKFSLIFLGLFAVATAAPLAIRRAEHVPAGVVGGRDIQNGDLVRRSDNSSVQVVHANDDGIKRNLGENLKTRQIEEVAEMVIAIVDLVNDIIEEINQDNTLRDQFTQNTVSQSGQQWPGFNWVICHTDHTTAFDGVQGTDWGHSHHELGLNFGSMGYELYWFRSGTFTRKGDGGYINWAYEGVVTGTEKDGSVVHFGKPT